jgi:hypothetical protein
LIIALIGSARVPPRGRRTPAACRFRRHAAAFRYWKGIVLLPSIIPPKKQAATKKRGHK